MKQTIKKLIDEKKKELYLFHEPENRNMILYAIKSQIQILTQIQDIVDKEEKEKVDKLIKELIRTMSGDNLAYYLALVDEIFGEQK